MSRNSESKFQVHLSSIKAMFQYMTTSKAVNTKLGKQTISFSEVITDIYHYFQENKAARRKRQTKIALRS